MKTNVCKSNLAIGRKMGEALTKKDLSRVEMVSAVKCKDGAEFASVRTEWMVLSSRVVGGSRTSINCVTKIQVHFHTPSCARSSLGFAYAFRGSPMMRGERRDADQFGWTWDAIVLQMQEQRITTAVTNVCERSSYCVSPETNAIDLVHALLVHSRLLL